MHTAYAVLPLYARSSQFSFLPSDTQANERRRCHRSSPAPSLNPSHPHCPTLTTSTLLVVPSWKPVVTNQRGLLSFGLKVLSARFVIHLHLSFFRPFSYIDIQDIEVSSLLSASHTPHPLTRLRSITLSMSSPLLLGIDPTTAILLPKTPWFLPS